MLRTAETKKPSAKQITTRNIYKSYAEQQKRAAVENPDGSMASPRDDFNTSKDQSFEYSNGLQNRISSDSYNKHGNVTDRPIRKEAEVKKTELMLSPKQKT